MVNYIEAKSILSKIKQKDTFFGIAYNMNVYRGCQHGCIYCDTRSECYGVGDISQISVKKNAIELLRKELQTKLKNTKATIGTGSMNDPYMPVEKELGMVRQALTEIARVHFPVHIITKSNLVTRDIDVLKDISQTYAAVSFTITTADDELSSKLESHAPKSSKRFKALEELAKNGIYTGITLMPVLPYINDTLENMETILRKAKDTGAAYIIPMFGMTLRKGSREYFYNELDSSFPGMKQKYEKAFGEQYQCDSPQSRKLYEECYNLLDKLQISPKMNFYEPIINEQLSLF